MTDEYLTVSYSNFVDALDATDAAIVSDCTSEFVTAQLLHGAIGISGEAGELLDAVKRHLFYGKDLDVVNCKEELGDLLFYMQICCHALGTNFAEIELMNRKKLAVRYGKQYSHEAANNRNLEAERTALEN